jgi:GNAT superfamily N-acetyltransferase
MVEIRAARASDISLIATHRASMFRDMGLLPDASAPDLIDATGSYLAEALPSGEYVGWLASPRGEPQTIVGGAGVQLRRILPFPYEGTAGPAIGLGRQGIVLNVYTEPGWRRRGIARELMTAVLRWARTERLESLVLHASSDGRALYEELGFTATNEMRLGA